MAQTKEELIQKLVERLGQPDEIGKEGKDTVYRYRNPEGQVHTAAYVRKDKKRQWFATIFSFQRRLEQQKEGRSETIGMEVRR